MSRVLLHVSASPRGSASISRRFGASLVENLQRVEQIRVVGRDLVEFALPYPDRAFVEASLTPEPERDASAAAALVLSETLIGELEIADFIVFDTPMHNYTVPAALKSWIDYVVRPGRTFRSTSDGKVGLLRDRPVYLVAACGGPVSDSVAAQTDFLTAYLRYVLATMGLRNFHPLLLDSVRRGEAAIQRADQTAREWMSRQILASLSSPDNNTDKIE